MSGCDTMFCNNTRQGSAWASAPVPSNRRVTLLGGLWQVGEYISHKLAEAEWGDGMVKQLADYLAQTQPGLRGFTKSNLFRMRQFCETYRDDQKVAPVVRQSVTQIYPDALNVFKDSDLLDFKEVRRQKMHQWSQIIASAQEISGGQP